MQTAFDTPDQRAFLTVKHRTSHIVITTAPPHFHGLRQGIVPSSSAASIRSVITSKAFMMRFLPLNQSDPPSGSLHQAKRPPEGRDEHPAINHVAFASD